MKRLARYAAVAALVVALAPVAAIAPAGAIPGAPVLTAPNDAATVTSNPVFAWNSVLNATNYRVQVSANASFTPLLVNVADRRTPSTATRSTFRSASCTGAWRPSTAGARATSASIGPSPRRRPRGPTSPPPPMVRRSTSPPIPRCSPGSPSWAPSAMRSRSTTSPASRRRSPLSPTSTINNSYTLTAQPILGQTYYWRVRSLSADNQPTQYSDVRSYTFAWPTKPVLEYPPNDNSPDRRHRGGRVPVDAQPKGPSATSLQVSPTDQFTALTAHGDHDQEHAVLAADHDRQRRLLLAGPCSHHDERGRRLVGDQHLLPSLARAGRGAQPSRRRCSRRPTSMSSVGLPEYSWTPVRLASNYTLEVGTDPCSSPGPTTPARRSTPRSSPRAAVTPTPGIDYYWRVKPLDGPANINGLYSGDVRASSTTPASRRS